MILIDTHVLLWTLFNGDNVSSNAKDKMTSGDKVCVSVASLWEIAIKQSIGKLDTGHSISELERMCNEAKIAILSIEAKHLDYINELPLIHNDPFDRLIMAQAVTEKMILISKDEKIAKYQVVNVVW